MIDAAPQREESFKRIGNVGFDLLGRHPRVERCHHHHRDVDRGKQIDRHTYKRHRAHDCHHQAEDNDEEGIADGKTGHYRAPPASPAFSSTGLGRTFSPARSSPRLPMTTWSPSARPASISTRSLDSAPNFTGRSSTRPSAPTTKTAPPELFRSRA